MRLIGGEHVGTMVEWRAGCKHQLFKVLQRAGQCSALCFFPEELRLTHCPGPDSLKGCRKTT